MKNSFWTIINLTSKSYSKFRILDTIQYTSSYKVKPELMLTKIVVSHIYSTAFYNNEELLS
jgi:hypothetical protein